MNEIISKTKILIVEDELPIAINLENRLKRLGYTICGHTSTGENALELIEKHPPDLIMMAIVLQGKMDGIDAAEAIRDKWDNIPVVFLASSTDFDRLKHAKLTYFFGYIFKPFKDHELKIATEMTLNVAKMDAERRHAEKALNHEKKMLARTERIAHIGSWELEVATGKVNWSEELFRMLRMDPSPIAPSWAEHQTLIHPEDFHLLKNCVAKAVAHGTPYEQEIRIVRKDGGIRLCVSRGFTEKDSNGQVQWLFGFLEDITERKQAEEKIRESEEKYYALFEQAADAIMLLDPESGVLVEYNERLYQNLGYSREEFEGLMIPDFELLESHADVARHTEELMKKGADIFETKHRTKNGEIRDIRVSSRVLTIDGKKYIQSILRDISKLKNAEKAVWESERRYRSLIELSPLGIGITNTKGVIVDVNPAFASMLGYENEALLGLNLRDMTHPDDLQREGELIKFLLNNEKKSFSLEKRYKHKKGHYFWTNVIFSKMLNFAGRDVFIFGFVEDISNRKKMEMDRDKLINELQGALAEIKELRGFLPICSNCKKIRDDDGYWQQVEKYIMDRTDAQFSHSICPDCIKKLYPDICDEID